ncbi:hypothetical protein A2678_00735 [Candidatus Kaiserbacteria bacterium RIFCSPHIGHO2_01_FULL_53_31]|uniref:Excinuclease ABC subunit C n=1 Tax=Candidatus Kaiserbacteria bacterium RIFCSPHIGHO2_01_FULL_53_31 TaxID=1798481 RepID=A0A1F6CHH6_9BACT|nr:MAG: hypothetical protein A2678_00735 [Candidatus Kaiserbacteria bacterium RIFCSPHIGHO2_01_FULL_53_31]
MQLTELRKVNLPDVPGVYLFKQGRKVLYVGKATSLRDRVRSYFDDAVIETRGPRIVDMVTRADRITFETTPTVLEALVREAALIKKYLPASNVTGLDDSTFLYVVITQESIPRVLTIRGKDIGFEAKTITGGQKFQDIFGPFPSGAQLREALRLVQRIFPFFDTERPVDALRASKHHHARIEFNTQIKQYPRIVNEKKYRKSIRNIRLFLSGRGKRLRTMLEGEMRVAAKEERFEVAAEIRRELFALDHIQDVSLIKDENLNSPSTSSGRFSQGRIEAYDTAHLSGTNAIGVMVVVEDSAPVKREYRTFRIRGVMKPRRRRVGVPTRASGNDDIASLKEILARRLGHPEWPFPAAIVVDGGRTHKKAAEMVLAEARLQIPVAAVVKDERHRPREVIGAIRAHISEADAVLANSEAHRFSLARHRRARSRNMRSK